MYILGSTFLATIVAPLFHIEVYQSLTITGMYKLPCVQFEWILIQGRGYNSCVDLNELYSNLRLLGLIVTLDWAINPLKDLWMLQLWRYSDVQER